MKTQDDKLVQSKLNSLDTLPEGYTPNIASKWTLIEEALDERRTDRIAFRKIFLRIAACLVLLLISAALWMNSGNENIMTDSTTQTIDKPAENAQQDIHPESQNATPQVAAVNKPNGKIHSIENTQVRSNVITVVEEELPVTAEENSAVEVAVTEPVVKKNRKRYSQVDFEEATPLPQIPNDEVAQSFSFKVSLVKRPEIANSNSMEPSQLRLTKNF
jgi:hypothetical protein